MKKISQRIIKSIVSFVSFFYKYETHRRYKQYRNALYSHWLKKSIRESGKQFYVESPAYFKGAKYMKFGEGFCSAERLRIECWDAFAEMTFIPELVIGNNVAMNYNVHIGCINKVTIGNNVLFASNIFITDHQHGYVDYKDLDIVPAKRHLYSKGPVIIEDNVWVGENVSIMPDVTIGKGSIVGANSVVTKSCPPNSIIAGVPAKILRNINE